mmetsp:Transcript_26494/g.58062  ORF Transcript_26494/g.58062 Transcript_26494/m.58062 type:complete len:383 (-) Transcript_26494:842-1990(-)
MHGADQRDAVRLARARVAHRHLDQRALLKRVLHLGEGDVLALLQLHQVLLAVDDLQVAVGRELADVARVEPTHALLVHRELLLVLLHHVGVGVVGVDQVAAAHQRAADEDLAAAHAHLGIVQVSVLVVAFLPVLELDAGRGRRRTDGASGVVAAHLNARRSASLGKAVALAARRVEGGLHKRLDLWRERRRSGAGEDDAASEQRLHLLEDELVVEPVRADDSACEVGLARRDAPGEERLDELARAFDLGRKSREHLVEDGGRKGDDRRLEDGGVAEARAGLELDAGGRQRVRRAEATAHAGAERCNLERDLHDVRERQVGQVDVLGPLVDDVARKRLHPVLKALRARHDALVRNHHALRQARGARRVHDHSGVIGLRRYWRK